MSTKLSKIESAIATLGYSNDRIVPYLESAGVTITHLHEYRIGKKLMSKMTAEDYAAILTDEQVDKIVHDINENGEVPF